jgi:NAD+ diphosphatase
MDTAAVERSWMDGVLMGVGPEPSVEVDWGGVTPTDEWLISSPTVLAQARDRPTQGVGLARRPTAGLDFDPARHALVGRIGPTPVFCALDQPTPGLDLRIALPLLTAAEAEAALTAVALANWHHQAGFCPACGAATEVIAAGMARWCPRCQQDLFPRTDPAIIVAVFDDDDRILLAHQRVWARSRYSIVAGFVEAGESLEQAVRREVAEEVGVAVDEIRYVSSQPWPMPRSLMLGFTAHTHQTALTPDGQEIAAARWFSRAEIPAAVDDGTLLLPGPASIAFRLISAWLTDPVGH